MGVTASSPTTVCLGEPVNEHYDITLEDQKRPGAPRNMNESCTFQTLKIHHYFVRQTN